MYFTMNIMCNGKFIFVWCFAMLIAIFVALDIHLYFVLQRMPGIVHQDIPEPGSFSPFKPLTMKLIMTDPLNHYLLGPSAEYFDEVSSFSKIFYFITPNMISITHVLMSLMSAKLVSSENLGTRRLGVAFYYFRSWLDDLDGVVYRSHTNSKGRYQSNHNTFGYYVDIYSDIIGGIFLMFGVMFYLWKCNLTLSANKSYMPLPLTKPPNGDAASATVSNSPNKMLSFKFVNSLTCPGAGGVTKNYIFFKVLCVGLCIAAASGTWDRVVARYSEVFQTDLAEPVLTQIQTDQLHSGSTWLIVYLWRIWEGQAIIHMVLVAIFIDKIWEFLIFFQYLGFIIILLLNIISFVHLNQIQQTLRMS